MFLCADKMQSSFEVQSDDDDDDDDQDFCSVSYYFHL